jgi:hypothetical protein
MKIGRISPQAYATVFAVGLALFPTLSYAEQSFSDVSPENTAYDAIEFLKANGIINGYSDGTFQPNKGVNRAEALKIIIGSLVTEEQIAAVSETDFEDISSDAWFLPYVEIAKANGIIDGPPKKASFNGGNPVIKVEFIKMLLLAYSETPVSSYQEIKLPLSTDVQNPDEWYYPYLRFAITSSMTMIGQDGSFHPAAQLTRGQTALLIHRYLMYKQGRRTQALLSEAENEILIVLSMLESNDIVQAEYASARTLLASRGAHAVKPDEPIVIGALKVSEAFRTLVRAYRAGIDRNFEEVVRLSGDAWNLADQAKQREASLSTLADQVQKISSNMANSARDEMAKTQ